MAIRMLIDAAHPEETRVVIANDKQILDFDFISSGKKQVKGNIYLAKITRVEPSLQAAFVEYGSGKQGFLPFSEIHADYYQIPAADRKRLLEEAASEIDDQDTDSEQTESSSETPVEYQATNVDALASDDNEAKNEGDFSLPTLHEIPALPDTDSLPFPEAHDDSVASGSVGLQVAQPTLYEAAASPLVTTDEPQTDRLESVTDVASDAISEPTTIAETSETGAEGVETIANDDEEVREQRKKRSFFKRYKIQEVIRRGQIVLIQVIKEERGNKGASLTTYLSLAGRYCVLMPNSPKDGGISRKIASPEDRKRLKAISTELRLAEGMSVIIRTAGMERPRAEIKRDFDYLVKLWNQIREVTLQSTAPALIYEESDVIKRAIRDQYTNEMDDVIVQGEAGYETARDFMKLLLPSHTSKIKLHKDTTPLFYAYDIEDQLMSMHDPVVKLKSGGYIVINSTEALIAVDVNSGRSTAERNIEETAVKTNLEAAAEVGRQLRLRDLAGLIVIDFIDMLESRNRRAVEKALKDVLKSDRAKIQLGRISPFGLLEMSRQRLRPSISETSMVQCPHCEGRGFIRSNESMSIQIIRALEKEASSGQWGSLRLIAPSVTALHILNHKRDILRAIEVRYGLTIQILIDSELTASEFNMEKMRRATNDRADKKRFDRSRTVDSNAIAAEIADQPMEEETSSDAASEPSTSEDGRPNRPRRGRRGGRNRRGPRDREPREFNNTENVASDNALNNNEVAAAGDNPAPDNVVADGNARRENRHPRGRGNRGGAGRKPWRDRDDKNDANNAHSSANEPAPQSNVVAFEPPSVVIATPPLPAFTQRPAVMDAPQPPQVNIHGESTQRDPNAPSKKGWWQRMIQLDD